MFKNILIPTDGSDLAVKAVEQGVLSAKEVGAEITALAVTEPFPSHLLAAEATNSATRQSNTRSTPRLTPRKCSILSRLRPNQPVSSARRFTSSTLRSIRQSSMPPQRETAI